MAQQRRECPAHSPRWQWRAMAPLLIVLAVLLLSPPGADAHAFLKSSNPVANAVLADTPIRVTLRFTEPLERVATTRAALFDQFGTQIETRPVEFDPADPMAMVLVMPDRLPNGTYSVVWQTLSSADGHRAQGYIPFTIGTVDDIQSVTPPALEESAGPPVWLQTLARWTSYLGLAITVAVFPVWLLVVRPAISPTWQAGPRATRRVRRLGYAGVGIALIGAVLALAVQIDTAGGGSGLISTAGSVLTDTRLGRIWVVRVLLLLAAAVALMSAAWWWPRRQRALTALTIGACAVTTVPFALVSHASAQDNGRATAIAFDTAHLLAASLWSGGLIVLVAGLLPTLRELTPSGRRIVLARALPRFSALALSAWAIIAITGLYAGWLQVGSLEALQNTSYGSTLTVKLLLVIPLLALAAFNLLVVSRHVKRAAETGTVTRWSSRFTATLVAEVLIVVVVLAVAGRLTSQAPGRDALAQEQNQVDIVLDLQGRPATLSLAPGRAGPNHYRLQIGGEPLGDQVEALLRLTPPDLAGAGAKEVTLLRVAGNAYETHGSEASLAGDWNVEVIVREIGSFQWSTATTIPIRAAIEDGPRAAWAFRPAGIAGLIIISLGFSALALASRGGRESSRREAAVMGSIAIVLGGALLMQSRISVASPGIPLTTQNPTVADAASIERGASTYAAMCISCHGVAGQGDGPLARTFSPPAADFTTAHSQAHLDAEFFNWIRDGKPPTDMPAFGSQLSGDQIWDVINYLRALQNAAATPVAAQ